MSSSSNILFDYLKASLLPLQEIQIQYNGEGLSFNYLMTLVVLYFLERNMITSIENLLQREV